jgi:hypothetical protein
MARYAIIENDMVIETRDAIPTNWNNISNFFALEHDEISLNKFGWYTIVKQHEEFDSSLYEVDYLKHSVINNKVIETVVLRQKPIIDVPVEDQQATLDQHWQEIRFQRDQRMKEFEWRYVRHAREVRLNATPTDNIEQLDDYMQQLADITATFQQPGDVIWPAWGD